MRRRALPSSSPACVGEAARAFVSEARGTRFLCPLVGDLLNVAVIGDGNRIAVGTTDDGVDARGQIRAASTTKVVVVMVGWPGKSTRKPSSLLMYSVQSWANADEDRRRIDTEINAFRGMLNTPGGGNVART